MNKIASRIFALLGTILVAAPVTLAVVFLARRLGPVQRQLGLLPPGWQILPGNGQLAGVPGGARVPAREDVIRKVRGFRIPF